MAHLIAEEVFGEGATDMEMPKATAMEGSMEKGLWQPGLSFLSLGIP